MWYGADMESPLEQALVAEWRDLVARKVRVWNALEQELDKRHGLSVSEFEVLDQLAEFTPDTKPRVQELADLVPITQSALSRLLGRLENQDLVERCLCTADRRGIFVGLTDKGRASLDAARPTHRAVLAAEFAEDGAASAIPSA